MRLCSDNSGCRPCSDGDGQGVLPVSFRRCLQGKAPEEEVFVDDLEPTRCSGDDLEHFQDSITNTPVAAALAERGGFEFQDEDELSCTVPAPRPASSPPLSSKLGVAAPDLPPVLGPGREEVVMNKKPSRSNEPEAAQHDGHGSLHVIIETVSDPSIPVDRHGMFQDTHHANRDSATFCCCGGCKEGTHIMDEKAVLREATWCLYCCCCGIGCGQLAMCRLLGKCICCRLTCDPAACVSKDGCASCICSLVSCHTLCQFPPRIGTPRFVCCGEIYCGLHRIGQTPKNKERHSETELNLHLFDHLLLEGCSPAYCMCCGCTLKQEIMPWARSMCKFACCDLACESSSPLEDDGIMYVLLTCSHLYLQCRFPPRFEQNPICAIAGKRCRSHKQHAVGVLAAPKQQGMMCCPKYKLRR